MLYFGGNAEEVSWMIEAARANTPGASWLLMDYRGYGQSDGAPSEKALVADHARPFFVLEEGVARGAAARLTVN